MKIPPIGPITPIIPITPISPTKKRRTEKINRKDGDIISDENLGKNVDISVTGPLKAHNCYKCVSYYVTWDPSFPHGCKKFEFKIRDELPSLGVYKANGVHCISFEKNPKIIE